MKSHEARQQLPALNIVSVKIFNFVRRLRKYMIKPLMRPDFQGATGLPVDRIIGTASLTEKANPNFFVTYPTDHFTAKIGDSLRCSVYMTIKLGRDPSCRGVYSSTASRS